MPTTLHHPAAGGKTLFGLLVVTAVFASLLVFANPVVAADAPVAVQSCLALRSADGTSADISWVRADDDNATRFIVERSRNNGTWFWAGRADAPLTEFTNTDLRATSTYDYRVYVKGDGVDSEPVVCADTPPPPNNSDPVAPISCTATRSLDAASATITWARADNDNATRFTVQRSRNNNGSWFWAGQVNPPVTELTQTGLNPDSTYDYRVFSRGDGPDSTPPLCTNQTEPPANTDPVSPVACTATRSADGTSATITWTRADNDNATQFTIQRSRNNGTWFWNGQLNAPAVSFTNTELNPNNTYDYRVFSRGDGPNSTPTLCTNQTEPPANTDPVSPVSCTATRSLDGTSATITWTRADNDNATQFTIQRSRNNGTWFWNGQLNAPAVSFTNTELNPNNTYDYRVFSRGDGPNSTPTLCTNETEPPPATPTAPISCTATRARFGTTATINWVTEADDGADKYVVRRSRDGSDWFWTAAVDPPIQSIQQGSLVATDNYDYRVEARGANGQFSEPTLCERIVSNPTPIDLSVDLAANPVATIDPNSTGLNLSWLLDSDIHRPRSTSTSEAIDAIGATVLRFPYGHLGDNYLWDTAPFGGVLEPRIASMHEAPGLLVPDGNQDWGWAVNTDGSFNDAMDFDEFVSIAQATDSQTLVMVNAAAHRYQNGPSYDDLKTTAVEWVRYAKDQGVQVDYWQIGNEVDHVNDGVLTAAEYIALYEDFTAAMREVDPTINVGPGLIGNGTYAETVIAAIAGSSDFTSAHQYASIFDTHWDWANFTGDPVANVTRMQSFVDQSVAPDLPILITETNSTGTRWDDGRQITTTKALVFFESLLRQHEKPNVVSSLMWSTHNPWAGENSGGDARNAFFNTDANGMTPNGRILARFESTTEPLLLPPSSDGFVHMWTSIDPATNQMSIHLLNKEPIEQSINIEFVGGTLAGNGTRVALTSSGPDDSRPTWDSTAPASVTGNTISTTLPATSMVILQLPLN